MIMDTNIQHTVRVEKAVKSYGECNVLNSLDMKVNSGTIYGLLGPSGCGKSTLLQCILGKFPLDSGRIDLKAKYLKDIGYMPQDLCLDEMLTINDTFEYYGSLYNMSKEQIENRKDELSNILEIPDMNTFIKNLSGGQSRRVSLAVSIFHDPNLIILDEPTVGIDPLLREKIWNYFVKMVKLHQKTIIITTHYIEEANLADRIGLMRNGTIIEEEAPSHILFKYNTDSLESAFLKLCCGHQKNKIDSILVAVKSNTRSKHVVESGKKFDLNRIKALLKKHVRSFSRDYISIFTLIFLPVIMTFVYVSSIGVDFKDIAVAVHNEEVNLSDCQYVLNEHGCAYAYNSINRTLSCLFTDLLSKRGYKFVEVKDRKAEESILKKAGFTAFLHFPKNYTQKFIKFLDNPDDYDSQSKVYVHHIIHNVLFKYKFLKDVTQLMDLMLKKHLNDCFNSSRALSIPLDINTVVGKDVKTIGHSFVSFLFLIALYYYPSMFAVSVMSSERMDGILSRSMFAGVTVLELLVSLFIIVNVLLTIQIFFPIIVIYVLFSNPIQITNGLIAYGIVVILMGWIGFFSGVILTVISPTKTGGVHFVYGLTLTQFFLSGGFWPIESQPQLWKLITKYLPMHVAYKAMNNVSLKGWTLDNSSNIMYISGMSVYIIILVIMLFAMGKFKKDMWVVHK